MLADFGEFALRSDDLDAVLTQACHLVAAALGTGRAKVLEIESKGQTLFVRAGVGWSKDVVGRVRLPLGDHSSETYSIKAGEPVITNDLISETRFGFPAFMREAGVRALANVPIFLPGGRPFGLLQVDAPEPRAFDDEDIQFLRTYATILGPVIDRLLKLQALGATEERFRTIVEAARDYAIVLTDPQDRITDWLPGAEAVFGWTAEEAIGQPGAILFTPEDREAGLPRAELDAARQDGSAPNVRWHLRKDGARVFIEGSVVALRDEAGELRGFQKIGQDVTKRHLAEQALRASEARLAAAFESVPAGVAVIDLAGKAVLANSEYRRFLPAGTIPSRDPERGSRWQAWDARGRLLEPDAYPGARALRGESVVPGQEMLYTDDDGRERWTNVATVPTRDEAGRVTGCVSVISDITDRKAAEAALRRSEAHLEAELGRAALLRDLAARMVTEESVPAIYEQILSTAVAITEADAGTVQVFDPETRSLLLLVSQGLEAGMTNHFRRIDASSNTACGIGLRTGQRTFVDFDKDEADEACRMHVEAGLRSAQATPLLSRDRSPIGMLNTHWRASEHRPSDDQLRSLDLLARQAADLIEQRRGQESLRESEERLRQFGEASQDVLWIRDAETLQWTYLTPAFETIYGLSREEALSGDNFRSWIKLIVPEDRQHAISAIRRVHLGEHVTFEYRVRRPSDGVVRWLRNTDFPLMDEGGSVRRIGGIGHDITDLKEAERRLLESEARLRAMVDAVPQIAWTARADGHHDYYNWRWYQYTGLSHDQSEAEGWTIVVHPDDLSRTQERWRHSAQTGEDYEIEYRLRGADGAYRWFIARGVPVRDTPDERHPQGRIARWFGICTDIEDMMRAREVLVRSQEELEALVDARTAELMAAEESLRQAQKMEAVGQLTGGIAHDFNNMLQGILSGIDMARRQIGQGHAEGAGRFLEAAHGAAERAAGLTRRLLAFARRQRLMPKQVDADGLVAGLTDLIRRTMGPGIAVELTLRDGRGTVLCDPNELESALLNLCINARDAMPEGGRLMIRTEEVRLSAAQIPNREAVPGTFVEISVADTGIGIPPEVLGRVFEPFFTTKPQGQGTGLGLSQIYGFVRQSGGLVRIESKPGRGTTIRLLLPLHEAAAVAAVAPPLPAPASAQARGTVLLVDDEDAVRGPAVDRLRELGLVVLEARDGPDALRVLSRAMPDLLVTDVGLPNGMNGRQVAEVARERIPGLPVLFITGYASTALPPGVEVIGKPFALDALARRVQAILEIRHQNPGTDPSA
ncbi:PAS domain S-box protein [Pseudoroseomonas ludipueritiae]|uniref:PAS domain S-box protein n=1 Tax=Pseudoroseomonas ludipueritiae TaxID=198093 RepID=UPI001934812B